VPVEAEALVRVDLPIHKKCTLIGAEQTFVIRYAGTHSLPRSSTLDRLDLKSL
jgi:hypothetical protein